MIENSVLRKSILLVEDELSIALIEQQELQNRGYSVYLCFSGEQAVQKVLEDDNNIHLILMDIELGSGIDGIQAAQEILKCKDIPILLLSDHCEQEIIERAEKIGVYGYILKNTSLAFLEYSIKSALKLFNERQQVKIKQDELTQTNSELKSSYAKLSTLSRQYEETNEELQQTNEQLRILHRELLESETKYRALFENMTNGFALHEIVCDRNGVAIDYRFLDLNPAFEKLTGLKLEHILGKTVKQVLPNTEQYWIDTFAQVAQTGKPQTYQNYSQELQKYFNVWAFSPKKDHFAVIISDYTEQKHLEDTLRENEERIRCLSDNLPNGIIYQIDSGYDGLTRHFTYISNTVTTFHEVSVSDVLRDPMVIYSQVHPEDMILLQAKEKESFTQLTPLDIEIRLCLPSGKLCWRHFSSAPRTMHDGRLVWDGYEIDITERKRIEIALQESEALFRLQFELGNIGITIATAEKNWLFVNKKLCDMLGYSAEELKQTNWDTLTHSEDIKADLSQFQRILNSEIDSYELDKRFVRKNGTSIYTHLCVSAYRNPDRTIKYTIGAIQDITERKRYEEALKLQLYEKEILLREVHHRIKNNIVTIELFLQFQLENITSYEAITSIQAAISRLRSMHILYNNLLLSEDYQEVSTRTYVHNLVTSICEIFPGNRKITVQKFVEDVMVETKKITLMGIIINELLTNIYKYAFEGRLSGNIYLTIKKIDESIHLSIDDDGIGYNVQNNIPDTGGFGLKIVQMITRQLNGEYSVESSPMGTKNTLKFNL